MDLPFLFISFGNHQLPKQPSTAYLVKPTKENQYSVVKEQKVSDLKFTPKPLPKYGVNEMPSNTVNHQIFILSKPGPNLLWLHHQI
jgi:hypothetical protein